MDDGQRTTEPAYTISSPGAFGSGELKIVAFANSIEPDEAAHNDTSSGSSLFALFFFFF